MSHSSNVIISLDSRCDACSSRMIAPALIFCKVHIMHEFDVRCAVLMLQMELNNGRPVGQSIPATEHSVMTAWASERQAIENMINQFGDGLFACVMDSYDYAKVWHVDQNTSLVISNDLYLRWSPDAQATQMGAPQHRRCRRCCRA